MLFQLEALCLLDSLLDERLTGYIQTGSVKAMNTIVVQLLVSVSGEARR